MSDPQRRPARREPGLAAHLALLVEPERTNNLVRRWVDAQDGPRLGRDPDAPGRDGDVSGLGCQPDGSDDLSRLRVDSEQCVVVAIADPDGPCADGNSARSSSDRDLADDGAR